MKHKEFQICVLSSMKFHKRYNLVKKLKLVNIFQANIYIFKFWRLKYFNFYEIILTDNLDMTVMYNPCKTQTDGYLT